MSNGPEIPRITKKQVRNTRSTVERLADTQEIIELTERAALPKIKDAILSWPEKLKEIQKEENKP